ncbi:hypothetical protein [Methanocella arvoryzae]|uniref:hypothetical protein n=1 Tax=Methanocella arvoryzae TaxID=1175445 RepID=UPI0013054276|nr:hypothetical protein [Methanocella arvoryzae]
MAFATPGTAAELSGSLLPGKRRTVQATLAAGYMPWSTPPLPYDENELRRFLRGGLAAK